MCNNVKVKSIDLCLVNISSQNVPPLADKSKNMNFKNLIFLIIIIANTSYTTNIIGQDSESAVQFGVKAGVNYANVYDSQGDEFRADGKFGFAGGVFLSALIGNIIGIQPEVMFSQKGFKAEGSLFGSNYGLTRTTNFIDIPIHLAVKPIPGLTILAGPQFSYLLRQKDVFNTSISTVEQIQEFENDNIRKNIFGLSAGLDFNVSHVVIGLRGSWDLSTNRGDGTSSTPRYKNALVQATLGFRFM